MRIQQAAQCYIDRQEFAGIEWRVQVSGATLTEGRAGLGSPLTGEEIPDQVIYRNCSMTKPIVSVMPLILVEQGMLNLFNPLAKFNPPVRSPAGSDI